MPGARPTGQLAYMPIKIVAIAAPKQVAKNKPSNGMPVLDIITGFKNIIYDMVTKVVRPAMSSVFIVVLCSDNLKRATTQNARF